MAKKTKKEEVIDLSEFNVEQLEKKLSEAMEEEDDDMIAKISAEKEKRENRKELVKRKFVSLQGYKDKMSITDAKYKPQSWIDMSSAFKDATKLPGIPECAVVVCGGLPDSGKSTVAIEAAAYAQKQGILPVFIITENKFSFERAETMGVDFEDSAIVHNGVKTIEEGCNYIKKLLDDQESGELDYDLLFIWDSVGSTPSAAELAKREDDNNSRGMMETARVLREQIGRYLSHRVNNTRNESYKRNATLLIVNQAYTAPPDFAGGQPKLVFYGGGGITYSASLIMQMGGVKSASSKITAIKDGTEISFAIRTKISILKNHITNISSTSAKIICCDHGFLQDDKKVIEDYKKSTKDGWDLNFDAKYWDGLAEL